MTTALKKISAVIMFCLWMANAAAQTNAPVSYKSTKVYFSKPGVKKGSSEPYKEVDNGAGLYQFTLFADHITIHKTETNDLKIVSLKQHKGETKYNLLDSKGRRFELYLSGVDKKGNANITLTEFDSNYAPVGTYMVVCVKQ